MKLLLTSISAALCLSVPALAAAQSSAANSARNDARAYGAAVRNCDMVWALESMYPPLMYSMADQMAGSGEADEAARAQRIMGVGTAESAKQAQQRRKEGMRKLREKYARMGQQMRASGVTIEEFSVGAPTAEYVVVPPTHVVDTVKKDVGGSQKVEDMQEGKGRTRIVILPTSLVCSAPDPQGRVRKIQRNSFIYAIRDEVRPENGQNSSTQLNKWYFIDGTTSINQIRAFFPTLPLNIKTPPCGDKVLN